MRFVDTNVLIYAATTIPAQLSKRDIARSILESRDLALSTQVLQEFYYQATHVSRAGRLSHQDAVELVESLARYPIQPVTLELVQLAMASRQRFQISYWDAAIIEAARALGCEQVLSEDLSHGQDYGGVVVVDPFRR